MEKIYLTKNEKSVLRLLNCGRDCPDDFPRHIFSGCVDSLEKKGLVYGAWSEGHNLQSARITAKGKDYIALYPGLGNPIDWKWTITTAIALVGTVAAIVALFVACRLQ